MKKRGKVSSMLIPADRRKVREGKRKKKTMAGHLEKEGNHQIISISKEEWVRLAGRDRDKGSPGQAKRKKNRSRRRQRLVPNNKKMGFGRGGRGKNGDELGTEGRPEGLYAKFNLVSSPRRKKKAGFNQPKQCVRRKAGGN